MNEIRRFGYARTATPDKDLNKQINLIVEKTGIKEQRVIRDEAADPKRPGFYWLEVFKKHIGEGDIIYITSIEVLGGTYQEIIKNWKEIREKNADLVVLENEEFLNSSKFRAMGDLGKYMEDQFLYMLAYLGAKKNQESLV